VVNYVGIVRGATQKLIKEELMGWHNLETQHESAVDMDWYPDDALVARLDSIVDELLSGEGPNNLVVLQDETYLDNMRRVKEHWTDLKALIMEVRAGGLPHEMFESSQAYFELVNETVFFAETYSDSQVDRIQRILIFANSLFVLLMITGLALYLHGLAVKRRAEALGKIAYIDPMTGLDNRASCERLIDHYRADKTDRTLTVFMFDMNDLKLTNDFLGHKGGDIIIAAFAKALRSALGDGFVGRFGGDEFLAVLEDGNEDTAEAVIATLANETDAYNEKQQNQLETIRYAVGYVIANTSELDIEDMINEADSHMYANKRRLKSL
jgi:diguanylate cyclase (GGDEF)-like protein